MKGLIRIVLAALPGVDGEAVKRIQNAMTELHVSQQGKALVKSFGYLFTQAIAGSQCVDARGAMRIIAVIEVGKAAIDYDRLMDIQI